MASSETPDSLHNLHSLRILISPAERHPAILSLGETHSLPETVGCDILWSAYGLCGVQRKAVSDLLASVDDGRLPMEVAQMKASLRVGVVVIEGRIAYTGTADDSVLLGQYGQQWTRGRLESLEMSIMAEGIWVRHSTDERDTARVVMSVAKWTSKPEHRTVSSFPKTNLSKWGTAENDDWLVRVLSSFPGISVTRARGIVGRWREIHPESNQSPLGWRMGYEELLSVPGIGPPTVKKLLEATGDYVEPEKRRRGKGSGKGKGAEGVGDAVRTMREEEVRESVEVADRRANGD